MQPTDTTAETSTTNDDDTTTTSTASETQSTSTDGGTSGSDSGGSIAPYGMCDDNSDCEAGGTCLGLYTNYMLNHHVCYNQPDCDSDDDCPAAPDGDAAPYCSTTGCTLNCSGGATCPAGMDCAYTDEGSRRCGWPD